MGEVWRLSCVSNLCSSLYFRKPGARELLRNRRCLHVLLPAVFLLSPRVPGSEVPKTLQLLFPPRRHVMGFLDRNFSGDSAHLACGTAWLIVDEKLKELTAELVFICPMQAHSRLNVYTDRIAWRLVSKLVPIAPLSTYCLSAFFLLPLWLGFSSPSCYVWWFHSLFWGLCET
jgi:hypothetical protein